MSSKLQRSFSAAAFAAAIMLTGFAILRAAQGHTGDAIEEGIVAAVLWVGSAVWASTIAGRSKKT